jgi:hypothetical protein
MKRARAAKRNEAQDAFGAPSILDAGRLTGLRPARQRLPGVVGMLLGLTVIVLAVGIAHGWIHPFTHYPTCTAAGIDSEGHEGTCVEGPLTSLTTVNVVDRSRTLRMPEYGARLLGSEITPTHVTNASANESIYPNGVGQLVSYELSITNTGEQPLQFGVGTGYVRRASYRPNPDVELALPESPNSNSRLVTTYPPIIEGRRAPTPSILQQPPIAPHETRTGWITFVGPAQALSFLGKSGADVDFYKVDGDRSYRGSIRLWK